MAAGSALGAAFLFAMAAALHARALRAVSTSTTDCDQKQQASAAGLVAELRLVGRALPSRAWLTGTAIRGVGIHPARRGPA